MRRFTTIAALTAVMSAAICAFANAQVAVGTLRADAAAYAVMDNGDVYRSNIGAANAQGPWVLYCNIFGVGGPPAPVVGVGGEEILTASGGYYRIAPGLPGRAIFDGVIEHSPGEVFVAFGTQMGFTNLCMVYAVTNTGSVYRGGCGSWEYAGSLPTGPTPTTPSSWGEVKSRWAPGRGATPQGR